MFLLFIKVVMGPFFFYQAFRLRKKITLLPDPEGDRQGQSGQGPKLKLLVIGDSAAVGVGVKTQDETIKGRLVQRLAGSNQVIFDIKAKSGSTSRDTLKYLNLIDAEEFDVALISLGVNDLSTGISNYSFTKIQKKIIDLLRSKFGAKQILLSGFPPIERFPVLPQPSRWYLGKMAKIHDQSLRKLAVSEGCDYIQAIDSNDVTLLASDGFHPGPKIYDYWAEKAYEVISSKAVIN